MIKQRRADRGLSTRGLERAAVRGKPNRAYLNEAVMVLLGYALLGLLIMWTEASLLRALLAAALALFGPGYALMAVLFPRRDKLDAVERAALAGGLSLAVGGMLGFLLTFSPWGLSLAPFLVASVLFSLGCLVLVWIRRRRLTVNEGIEQEAESVWSTRWQQWWSGQGRVSQWVTVVLAVLLVAGVAVLGWKLMLPAADPPMTEFYLLNSNGQAQDYPAAIVPGQSLPISFGVTNREAEPANYQVRALMAGEPLDASSAMVLRPGETWLGKLHLVLPREGAAVGLDAGPVEFVLEREGQPYRSLHLWLAVEDGERAAAATLGQ